MLLEYKIKEITVNRVITWEGLHKMGKKWVFPSWIGKNLALANCVSFCEFLHCLVLYETLPPDHRMTGFPPHQAVLYGTSGESYDLTQFWHYLPGSIRSQGSRALFHRPQILHPHQNYTYHLCLVRDQKFHFPPPLSLINFLEQFIELRETFTSLL